MLNPVISIIVYLTEMLISYIFFSNISERKLSSTKCLTIGGLLFATGSVINLLFSNNVVINTLVTILLNFLFALLCFDIRVKLSVFYSFILIAIGAAWEFVAISSISVLTDSHFFDYNSNFALFILECPICKILYFLTVLILSRIVKPGKRPNALPFSLILYPIGITACLILFWYICAQSGITEEIQRLLAIASMVLLSSTVFLFVTYQHQIEKDSEAIQIKNEFSRLQTEKTYYNILEQQNEQLMIFAHDAKKHLAAINSLDNDPQIKKYTSMLSAQLAEYTHSCQSGNKLLDVMIHKFSVDCQMRGISFDYDVKLCNLIEVQDIDLVAILGNLMDNAISAAEKSASKKISLETTSRNSYSVIIISNSCDTPPKARNNTLMTSKIDTHLHGFGLKSVSKTLKKYQGDFEWEYDQNNRIFTLTVMIGNASNHN